MLAKKYSLEVFSQFIYRHITYLFVQTGVSYRTFLSISNPKQTFSTGFNKIRRHSLFNHPLNSLLYFGIHIVSCQQHIQNDKILRHQVPSNNNCQSLWRGWNIE